MTTAVFLILGLASIWFDNPERLATVVGLVTAGLSFALQKVVTSVAGYFVILRGKTFNVGDRIRMGGVRGDVIDLGFIQTSIMEMGEPPAVQSDAPGMWVLARQYTGRVVTVSNSHIFDEPVYNYTRNFPFIWEEMHLPVPYGADRRRAERILLDAAKRHAAPEGELSSEVLAELKRHYGSTVGIAPRVYYRLTDNWLELTVRFVVQDHGIREVKDAMARDILAGLEEAGIGIASGTYDIVGLPPIRIEGLSLDGLKNAQLATLTGLCSPSLHSFGRQEIIRGRIDLDAHVLVLVEQTLVVHLPGDGPDLARFRHLETEDLHRLAADRLGDGHACRAGGRIDQQFDLAPLPG